MTAMEIRINLHRISEQEIDTLCAAAAGSGSIAREPEDATCVIKFPARGRYS
jgi:hypothetical protein